MRKHNDFSAVGARLRRGCILIRNRDGDDDVPCTCTHAKTVQVHANKRDNLVKQSKRIFFVAGGDNRAENRLGQIKTTMRRCGTLKGHYSSKYKRIQVLAAAALRRKPGIIHLDCKFICQSCQPRRNRCVFSCKMCGGHAHAFFSWFFRIPMVIL